MLGLVRSMKNDFAPISRIPPDVFSLIPGYLEGIGDKNLIRMTHVCRGWRELLIACPSLWAHIYCENADRTRVYIERSKLSPLKLSIHDLWGATYLKDALLLVVPHVSRLKSLIICGRRETLQTLTPHFSCPLPLLRELIINLACTPVPVLDTVLFNGDLSSLCSLSLSGVTTHLPWKNLSRLTTFNLSRVSEDKISITQLLDFFEDAHHLRDITLNESVPTSSNAPPGRMVSLPCLKKLVIHADLFHSIILNHLSIPAGASMTLDFEFTGDESPVTDFLPKSLNNLKNIYPISSINLSLDGVEKCVRLEGQNGGLYMFGEWVDQDGLSAFVLDNQILRSLSCFDLSGTQRLAVARYISPTVARIDKSAPYYILSRMKDLRTLTLTQCNNLPFILALNPVQNPSKCVIRPEVEALVLYVKKLELFRIEELESMAKERVSAGKKLPSVTIIGLGGLLPGREVFKLKKYVTRVDYRVQEQPPEWDNTSEDGGK